MRKWLIIFALSLSMGGIVTSSTAAAPPFASSCEASEQGLTTAGERSDRAPSGGVRQGKDRSSEFSQLNFCNQP